MDLINEIKNRINLLQFVQGYITLHKSGSNWKGLCPFHQEKTPSFMVDERRFKCFGCGEGGDVITFYQKYFNKEMKDALKELAVVAGIVMDDQYTTPEPAAKTIKPDYGFLESMTEDERYYYDERAGIEGEQQAKQVVQLIRINHNQAIFNDMHQYCKEKGWNYEAYEYMKTQRCLEEGTIEKFKIFFIRNYNEVNNHLKKRWGVKACQRAGLFNYKENGDGNLIFFNHRIVIPYLRNDEIVYLRGRYWDQYNSSDSNNFKYLGLKNDGVNVNTPKRFFNLDITKYMLNGERLYITEGEFDCMVMTQLGYNCIAVPGVGNLNEGLISRILRFDIILVPDNDEAGVKLTDRFKEILSKHNKTFYIKHLPKKDVTEFVRV